VSHRRDSVPPTPIDGGDLRRQSDEGVVPMKQSNKEGVSSGETGREGPRPRGTATGRGPDTAPGHLPNGLAAVRRAARQSKTVRFTALLGAVSNVVGIRVMRSPGT
jgi:hypothetical protein